MTPHPTLDVASTARTHVGCVRRLNEDALLERSDVGLWAVADGMGGHQAGEVASAMVVEALAALARPPSVEAMVETVSATLQDVNRALLARAAAMGGGAVVGATAAVLVRHEGRYACLWAGDSRIYRLRRGRLERLTRDHSLVQDLVDAGELSAVEARTHRQSNIITRAVGVAERLGLDVRQGSLAPGDLFLLCTDGLTGMLDDEEIAHTLLTRPMDAAADLLLEQSLERGARDNVTLVLVHASPDLDATSPDVFASGW